ncbi:phospholipase D/nuclease [Flagelloscypha sp. PMI_526]|nr:phospholipase D/nuclease [Flagelloscypha sp. PMI_526]
MSKFITKVAGHARNELIGLFNPNRRHDDPEEKKADEIREEIRNGHRFRSFAEEREGNFVKWHIDGHDYMWAVSELIDNAKECIFILDWWLTPELYLRRPPAKYPEYRIDRLLKRKAEQGVKVHIIVYKEVTQTMSMSSAHTKKTLTELHPNILVLRHPDHIGAKDSIQFWSHHEKVVVVDNHFAAIGGLDLCFGRWDTHTHPLADAHPTNFDLTLFPGQDYNNARVLDFQEVYNYASNAISILETGRMPWHDVHMTFVGPSVLDVIQHFVERWNEVKKRKHREEANIPWLALPHDVESAPNEAVAQHPTREDWHKVGHQYKQRFHSHFHSESPHDDPEEHRYQKIPEPSKYSCKVQVCRSISDWSHGYLTENSIQQAYIELITNAEHYIYIENQFFVTNTVEGQSITNQIGRALVDRIIKAAKAGEKFKVVVTIPEVPGFAGDIKAASAVQTILAAQWRGINRGGNSIYEKIREAGYEPMDYIRFFHLRSYDRINAPYESFIKKMEDASGVKFSEAQVALAREWIGDPSLLADNYQKEVAIKFTTPNKEGLVEGKDTGKIEKIPIPESKEAARDTIRKFERGADSIRGDEDVSDSVAQHMLRDRTGLQDEKWLGTEEEELNAYVSELLYIHSKVMIVDDRKVIMGSANINDRSQKGDGDSEIALVVEDHDMVDSTMDGKPYQVARFAASLRRKLYREHLGLISPQICDGNDHSHNDFIRPAPHANPNEMDKDLDHKVADPISDATWELWTTTASTNRQIFQECFKPVPSNLVRNWKAYDNYVPKVKVGHVAPDITLSHLKERLSLVKGALVEAPLDFLIEENDMVTGAEWTALNPTLPIYI